MIYASGNPTGISYIIEVWFFGERGVNRAVLMIC